MSTTHQITVYERATGHAPTVVKTYEQTVAQLPSITTTDVIRQRDHVVILTHVTAVTP